MRELNIFNCSISVQGLAAIVQTNHSLRELKRGIPLCDALGYQALINEATWTMQKKLKLEVFQVNKMCLKLRQISNMLRIGIRKGTFSYRFRNVYCGWSMSRPQENDFQIQSRIFFKLLTGILIIFLTAITGQYS